MRAPTTSPQLTVMLPFVKMTRATSLARGSTFSAVSGFRNPRKGSGRMFWLERTLSSVMRFVRNINVGNIIIGSDRGWWSNSQPCKYCWSEVSTTYTVLVGIVRKYLSQIGSTSVWSEEIFWVVLRGKEGSWFIFAIQKWLIEMIIQWVLSGQPNVKFPNLRKLTLTCLHRE